MQIQVNGETKELTEASTVRALLSSMEADVGPVAVELNRKILPREQYDRGLEEGDQIEIVTFVGGG